MDLRLQLRLREDQRGVPDLTARKFLHIAVGILQNRAGEVLICQRPAHKLYPGEWEFPGGKVEPGEDVRAALRRELHEELAQAVVRDGEGATRFVTVRVGGARSVAEARQVAYAVAHSPLVKTALFAGDANWGRLAMAIGKAGVKGLDPKRVDVALDDVAVLKRGEPHPDYREERGAAVLANPEFTIAIGLGRGKASARVWTCDFSYDYVKINAEYRT